MASSKLADLTATTALADTDLAYVVKDPSGTPVDRKITGSSLKTAIRRTVQVVNTQTGAVATGTTTMPMDDTIPQNTEGTEFMTLAITPTNAVNLLRIEVEIFAALDAASIWLVHALFQDTTADALKAVPRWNSTVNGGYSTKFSHYMTAGTTSVTTFKVRAGGSAASTVTFNGVAGARFMGGVMASSITITEILA